MGKFKTFIEIEVVVDYDYQPYKPQPKDCPETYAEVTINMVGLPHKHEDIVIGIKNFLDKSTMESIKEQCFEQEQKRHERV